MYLSRLSRNTIPVVLIVWLVGRVAYGGTMRFGVSARPESGTNAELLAIEKSLVRLEKALRRASARGGPVATLVVADDRVVYQQAVKGDGDQDMFVTASSSKWLIASVMMALVDKGLISLDAPVSRYLPEFDDGKGGITIRHLLSHTSGLPPNLRPRRRYAVDLETAARHIGRTVKLSSEPGTRFCYGNLSFQVAARVAEVVARKRWPVVFREQLGEKTGMTKTHYPMVGLGGGLYQVRTTLHDYVHFLRMFQNRGVSLTGERVLSEEAVFEMLRDQTTHMEMSCIDRRVHEKTNRMSYGLGLWRELVDPITDEPEAVSHFGTSGFGGVINFSHRYVVAMGYKGQRRKGKIRLVQHYVRSLPFINRLADIGHFLDD